MDRAAFVKRSAVALEHIEDVLGDLEHEAMDVELAGDVLTIGFDDGVRFVINAHSAAGQIWMAAHASAWHFDWDPERDAWIANKSGDELMATVAGEVGRKLGVAIAL